MSVWARLRYRALDGDSGTQGVHMKEADVFGDAVLDEHAVRVTFDEFDGLDVGVVGEEQGGLFVTQAAYGDLAKRVGDGA